MSYICHVRYIEKHVLKDLSKKMVFIAGPRQVGKTTLAQQILSQQRSGLYLNWDDVDHRRIIRARRWTTSDHCLILDEIHKFSRWKNFLKGTFDTQKNAHLFLITGSARLEISKTRGDSLFGRYHLWRLHPFCLAERPQHLTVNQAFERLLSCGGFPEPFLSGDPIEAKRWAKERTNLVLRGDARDVENVREIDLLESLSDALTEQVGTPIVMANLARDLEIAPKTVKKWISILDRLYICFVVEPFSGGLPRAWIKAPKVFFWNVADVPENNPGARIENLVGQHILKRLHYLEDRLGDRYKLCYVRDREEREVDFLILKNKKPYLLIEVKSADSNPHAGLKYFSKRLGGIRAIQLVLNLEKEDIREGIEILSLKKFLAVPLDAGI